MNATGVLGAGQYYIQVNAGFSPGLPNGVNHSAESGGFDLISITVQVPEPATVFLSLFGSAIVIGRVRSRCRY